MAELQVVVNQEVQLGLENSNSVATRGMFDPVAHDLEASFRLTRFADLKG